MTDTTQDLTPKQRQAIAWLLFWERQDLAFMPIEDVGFLSACKALSRMGVVREIPGCRDVDSGAERLGFRLLPEHVKRAEEIEAEERSRGFVVA